MRDKSIALIAASVIMFILLFLLAFYRDGAGYVWLLFLAAGVGFAAVATYSIVQDTAKDKE
ncbi:MAG: hypothetical protein HN929_05865 [Chloroflexi bacterium]|jgi:hypothetical protein|nr:hypothetical protein [Chloroflexota bacterium]MBT7080977.1 hypothetical protein [Chloroflexota bacterium]MBT7290546.1 hypothetical protein [Chloroflexota bacterium]